MKTTKIFPRLWIAITSLAALLGGWMVFSHTQPSDLLASLIPSTTLTSQDSQTSSSQSTLQQLPSAQSSAPASNFRLRTRGS